MPSCSEMYFLRRVSKSGRLGWLDELVNRWFITGDEKNRDRSCSSLKLFLNVCLGTQRRHFLLSLDLSLKNSAVNVFSFDMEMRTLILAGGPARLGDPTALGDCLNVESGRAEFIWSLFPLPSSTLLSEVLFPFWCSLSYLKFFPVLREISSHFQKQNKRSCSTGLSCP